MVDKAPNKPRQRMCWTTRMHALIDDNGDLKEFLKRYKLSPDKFKEVADRIRPLVEARDKGQAKRSSRGGEFISAEIRLSIFLRFLAGGHYLDLVDIHGVSTAEIYNSVHRVAAAINKEYYDVINFPIRDKEALLEIAKEWESESQGAFPGCVGAVDGIALEIDKPDPLDCENPSDYWNHKVHGHALVFQVICDARCRVRWLNVRCTGDTNDALAWEASHLHRLLKEHPMDDIFYIIGDDAYKGGGDVITPFPGKGLSYEKDNFNFWQSSTRMKIEQTFGIWKERWGFFNRSSGLAMQNFEEIVRSSFILHNLVIDDPVASIMSHRFTGSFAEMSDIQPGDNLEVILNDVIPPEDLAIMRDRNATKRAILAMAIDEKGLYRPDHSDWGRNANINHR